MLLIPRDKLHKILGNENVIYKLFISPFASLVVTSYRETACLDSMTFLTFWVWVTTLIMITFCSIHYLRIRQFIFLHS